MARLAYYKGEYNPMAQGGDPSIISMYNPEAQQQFLGAVQERQKRFDQGNMEVQAEKARIGETETYDMKDLTNRLNAFESNINDLVKTKYNGDYGAAANEIANSIGTERTNPFYAFNKQKVEMGKAYMDAKMKMGPDFLSAGNPFDVSFSDWQNGKSLQFTPINKNAITQSVAEIFKPLSEAIRSAPQESLTPDQQFIMLKIQKGMATPQEVMHFVQNDPNGQKMMQQALSSMPELAGVKDQKAVMNAAMEGAYQAIGSSQIDFRENPAYADALIRARKGQSGANNGIIESGRTLDQTPTSDLSSAPEFQISRDKRAALVLAKLGKSVVPYNDAPHAVRKAVDEDMQNTFANNKDFASPYYTLNPTAEGVDTKAFGEYEARKKIVNTLLNNLPQGTLHGSTAKDSKAMKELSDYELKGYQYTVTEDPNMPIVWHMDVTGLPPKKGTGTPVRQPVSAKVAPDANNFNQNFIHTLYQIDPQKTYDIINRLIKAGNLGGAKLITSYIPQ